MVASLETKHTCALLARRSKPLPCVPPCPTDWIRSQGMCYYFSKEKRNWTSSQNFCLFQKATLLTFNPSLEKDFVMLHKGKAPFWIGLKREPNQPWKWTNGENATLEVIGEGHCAYLNNEAAAISLRCRTELFWICQKTEAS
ncbi:C-type lectin domain family 2 member D-like [Heteronotia binoei]|uniref:C-type lectin domain family 2 member D-like n=1 Tax=Heteronotia binoei TaxID=13085 RepID=UPI00292F4DAC|nr:C-type lectin domain family 2 member D-like [Heteronotia binoei]